MHGPKDGTTKSQVLMKEMAEKHKGMFGKVVKNSIRKMFPQPIKGTVISPRSKISKHNNANSVSAKMHETIMI